MPVCCFVPVLDCRSISSTRLQPISNPSPPHASTTSPHTIPHYHGSLVVVLGTIVERNGGHDTEEDYHKTNLLIHRLFHIFDIDSSGAVDFSELASGLSVLCGGSRDDKAEAAFALYDYNGDGFISLEEMTRYLASVFKVMFEVPEADF